MNIVEASPVRYQTSPFDGSIARSPEEREGRSSETGVQVFPRSLDRHTPPFAAPA